MKGHSCLHTRSGTQSLVVTHRSSSCSRAGKSLAGPARCQSSAALVTTTTELPTGSRGSPTPAGSRAPTPQAQPAVAPIVQLQPETFHEFLRAAGDQLVLVDYYTDWCGPCQIMHKEMDKLTRAFPKGVLFAKFNCGPHSQFSTSQRIRSLPTFRLFQRGRCLEQITGAKPVQLRQLLTHYYRPAR